MCERWYVHHDQILKGHFTHQKSKGMFLDLSHYKTIHWEFADVSSSKNNNFLSRYPRIKKRDNYEDYFFCNIS